MRKIGGSGFSIGSRLWPMAVLCILYSVAVSPVRGAQNAAGGSPQDRFLQIYVEIQDADRAAGQGFYTKAAEQYREAQAALQELHRSHPQWERQIVEYRL
ncbi:MAG: hypothetical protein PHO89_03265, partial [Methylacidiphilaceae bacterium]|nr:hypothetical protein [Candidatus Methylacidiphilaceae bacterium]